jgi:hypothetical protein
LNDRERRRVLDTRNFSQERDGGVLVAPGSSTLRSQTVFDTVVGGAVLTVRELADGVERTFDVALEDRPLKLGRTPHGGSQGANDIVLSAPFVSRD